MLLIRKSKFGQKVIVHKDQKSLHKQSEKASKRDVLELATLRYQIKASLLLSSRDAGLKAGMFKEGHIFDKYSQLKFNTNLRNRVLSRILKKFTLLHCHEKKKFLFKSMTFY